MTVVELRLDQQRAVVNVGLIADTHGWLAPSVADDLAGCDLIVHAGDVCGFRVLEQVAGLSRHLVAVAGNNDRPGPWTGEHGSGVLGDVARVWLPGGLLAVEHGHRHDWNCPAHEDLRRAHPQARAVVYGHTHRLVCDTQTLPWVVNPGAAGRVRTHGGPSWVKLTASTRGWHLEPRRRRDAA